MLPRPRRGAPRAARMATASAASTAKAAGARGHGARLQPEAGPGQASGGFGGGALAPAGAGYISQTARRASGDSVRFEMSPGSIVGNMVSSAMDDGAP